MLRPRLAADATAGIEPAAKGEGACPGVATGIAVTTPDEAEKRAATGEDVILLRQTTSPDDVHGMIAARAIVTAHGGATSHAAVVSRALGRPCVVGCGDTVMALAGEMLTVDGAGQVWRGALPTIIPGAGENPWLAKLLAWAEEAGETKFAPEGDVAELARTGTAHG